MPRGHTAGRDSAGQAGTALVTYLERGGNIYIAGSTGMPDEMPFWNAMLRTYGMEYIGHPQTGPGGDTFFIHKFARQIAALYVVVPGTRKNMHEYVAAFMGEVHHLSWKEVVAAVTGLISVVLAVRNNIWTWPWGIVSVILYAIVFRDYKLFANAGLQVFCFLPLSVYAWWAWLRCGPKRDDDLPIAPLSARVRWVWAGITVVLSIALVMAMKTPAWADPNPYADGITTALSIVAQCLQSRKIIENWWLWIAADLIYAFYLFPDNKLYFSTMLYVIFLGLALLGWREWKRLMQKQHTQQVAQMLEGVTQAHD